ncbi:hypothetical protein D3C81_1780440 [compost metagenome]
MTFQQAVERHLQLVDVVVQIEQENAELRATAFSRQMLAYRLELFDRRRASRQPLQQATGLHFAEDWLMIFDQ